MAYSGKKAELFITAWGETKTYLQWEGDARCQGQSKQGIRYRHFQYLEGKGDWTSTEHFLLTPKISKELKHKGSGFKGRSSKKIVGHGHVRVWNACLESMIRFEASMPVS